MMHLFRQDATGRLSCCEQVQQSHYRVKKTFFNFLGHCAAGGFRSSLNSAADSDFPELDF